MAEQIADKWTANGVPASLAEYQVFLSYPKEHKLVLNLANGSRYTAQIYEDVLEEDETTGYPGAPPAFHGYSKSGEVNAEYVYAGRGHKDDFVALKAANVTLKGKIALTKYGGPFRGMKVQNAEAHDMIGVVIFSDPGDDGPQEAKGQAAYPKGPARQPSSVQRGSVAYINQYPGDPTTPGRPSKPGVERVSKPSNLPKIPSLPISYRDAIPILQALDGHGLVGKTLNRDGWVGGLNATYSTGPAPGATLSLKNLMEEKITPIWNVIGIINGTNADETIIIGNHRDAWIIGGAADPNSGSAILVEMTKVFGEMLKMGWKPRRNIVFASWDAEEYALIGSTEWVEDYAPWLSDTAISYLNVDIAVSGPLPGAGSTPELREFAQEVMKKVIYGKRTLYDAWYDLNQFRPEDNGFTHLGSGSDYTAFLQLGIGALDFGMDAAGNTPVYHYLSNYDSYYWMKTFIDPDFSIHATTGQYLALLAYHLAHDSLIPFDMDAYARNINYMVRDLISITPSIDPDYEKIQQMINVSELDNAAKNFQRVAYDFVDLTSSKPFLDDSKRVKKANGILRDVQRLFVRREGLPGRPFYKNGLYAPNRDDGYKAQTLPGSVEALQDRNFELCREWNLWLADAINKASEMLALS
ncbi:Zn-dependent exopeptidase [Cucurbitaria berberidis CBS 394.84]|uniref:Zn-dependent exopeptidase n=1 Tax=Cucurbitaria berberidis CBS 394.84 TaxID=1168544 RepID=A0A9P4L357_9PLEO|nr:Zn-dependent exopeptidase [Cucurbitaria berberidis CBS 394.84]KAF1839990.1 Zn-dependent exopeptidase [Cucurbitaria berberidis CBS 394.84]